LKKLQPFLLIRLLQSSMTKGTRTEQRELIIGHSAKNDCCWYVSRSAGKPFGSSARDRRPKEKEETMRKAGVTDRQEKSKDDMLAEYRLDYSKARPNRFARKVRQGSRVVLLDPDVAAVFMTQDSVNDVLRALIRNMPSKIKP
jgi:hypothetical protein